MCEELTVTRVIIGVGSNVESDQNIRKVQEIFLEKFKVVAVSKWVKTRPLGYIRQEDFVNGAIHIETHLSPVQLKQALKDIEVGMGREPGEDKWGPRIIDLDILIWNGQVVDTDVYTRDFLKTSCLELDPSLLL